MLVGVIPAAIIGVLLDDLLDKYLYNYIVVSIALIAYGIVFIFIEKFTAKRDKKIERVEDISYTDALKIGAFQLLSLIPGTSRSGSTIIGGLVSGVSREAWDSHRLRTLSWEPEAEASTRRLSLTSRKRKALLLPR